MSNTNGLVVSRIHVLDPHMPAEVEFELSRPARVTLTLYDTDGRERKVVFEGRQFAEGTHRVNLPSPENNHEILFYRLVVQTDTERIVDMKRIIVTAEQRAANQKP